MNPLVTVVTPSYNQGRFIRATIESVLAQDYPAIEYIVMDGGSTDETAAVVSEYAGRLKWISEKDRGQSHAINKGFRMARGEFVSWLNSDDLILPGAVRHAVETFGRNPDLGAVYGEGYLIDETGDARRRFPATEPFNLWKLIHLSDFVLQQTLYFRKCVFDEVGYLDENLHWGMDWEILMRIGKRYPIEYIPQYMGSLREYGEAKTFSGGARRFRELARIMRLHSGKRYPPGYITYGLDTYEKIWNGWVERHSPEFLGGVSAIVQKYITLGCRYWIDRTLREAQGWYSDGWAAPVVKYMLPPGRGKLRIEGMQPDLGLPRHDQEIRVIGNRTLLQRTAVPLGEFEVALPLTPANGAPVALELKASRSFRPGRKNGDSRRLAYVLKRVQWVPE